MGLQEPAHCLRLVGRVPVEEDYGLADIGRQPALDAMFIFYWMKESFINQNVGVETKMRFKNVIYTNLNRPTVPSGPF